MKSLRKSAAAVLSALFILLSPGLSSYQAAAAVFAPVSPAAAGISPTWAGAIQNILPAMSAFGPSTFLEKRMINVLGSTRGLLAQDQVLGLRSMEFINYLPPQYQRAPEEFQALPPEVQMSDLSAAVSLASSNLRREARELVRRISSGQADIRDAVRLERISAENRFYLTPATLKNVDEALASIRTARAETLMEKIKRTAAHLRGPSSSELVGDEVKRLLDGAYQVALQNGVAVDYSREQIDAAVRWRNEYFLKGVDEKKILQLRKIAYEWELKGDYETAGEFEAMANAAVPPPVTVEQMLPAKDENLRNALSGYLEQAFDAAISALKSARVDPARFCEELVSGKLLAQGEPLSLFLSDRNEKENFIAMLAQKAALAVSPDEQLEALRADDRWITKALLVSGSFPVEGNVSQAARAAAAAAADPHFKKLLDLERWMFSDARAIGTFAVLCALFGLASFFLSYPVGAVLFLAITASGALGALLFTFAGFMIRQTRIDDYSALLRDGAPPPSARSEAGK
ncbi:MAG: hypothetical protein WCU88_10165 [Elusimicrobiota bacterium]|jgi:hypothetical protein